MSFGFGTDGFNQARLEKDGQTVSNAVAEVCLGRSSSKLDGHYIEKDGGVGLGFHSADVILSLIELNLDLPRRAIDGDASVLRLWHFQVGRLDLPALLDDAQASLSSLCLLKETIEPVVSHELNCVVKDGLFHIGYKNARNGVWISSELVRAHLELLKDLYVVSTLLYNMIEEGGLVYLHR